MKIDTISDGIVEALAPRPHQLYQNLHLTPSDLQIMDLMSLLRQ